MEVWFGLALLATLFFGVQTFLQQVAAKRDKNSFLVTAVLMLVPACIALIYYLLNPQPIGLWQFALLLAMVDGFVHGGNQIIKIEALRFIPSNVFLPIFRGGTAIIVLYGIFVLGERLTLWQVLGIILSFLVIWILATEKQAKIKKKHVMLGVGLGVLGMVLSGTGSIIVKTAADKVNLVFFTIVAYGFSSLYSFIAYKVVKTKNTAPFWRCVRMGAICGLLNGAGWVCMALALKYGKASIVFPMIHMYILITMFIAMVVYNEEMTKRRALATLLTVTAIFLFI